MKRYCTVMNILFVLGVASGCPGSKSTTPSTSTHNKGISMQDDLNEEQVLMWTQVVDFPARHGGGFMLQLSMNDLM